MSKKRAMLIGTVIGVALIVVAETLDFSPWLGLAVFVVGYAAVLVYCKVYVTRRYAHLVHRQLQKSVDPTAAAPTGAPTAENELIRRLHAARSWDATVPLLADDFQMVDVRGRRLKRQVFKYSRQMMRRTYPELETEVQELLADPREPGVFHSRERTVGKARRGPDLDMTAWSRYALTPDGTRVREIACTAVVSVA
jgi:hypothetical protein